MRLLSQVVGAFRLAEELATRHDFHGLGRRERQELQLMQQSWARLHNSLVGVAAAAHDPEQALGRALTSRLDAALEVLVPVPAHCATALSAGGWGVDGWVAWDTQGERDVVLVRHPARQLAGGAAGGAAGRAIGTSMEPRTAAEGQTAAFFCRGAKDPSRTNSQLQRLALDKVLLCPGGNGVSCVTPLMNPEHTLDALLGQLVQPAATVAA